MYESNSSLAMVSHYGHKIHEFFAMKENQHYRCPKIQWEPQVYYRSCGLAFNEINFGTGQVDEHGKTLKPDSSEYKLRVQDARFVYEHDRNFCVSGGGKRDMSDAQKASLVPDLQGAQYWKSTAVSIDLISI